MNWRTILLIFFFIGASQSIFAQSPHIDNERVKEEPTVPPGESNGENSSPLRVNDKKIEQVSIEAAKAHYNLGTILFKSGEYREAANEYERVIKLMPEDPLAYYNLGVIYDDYLEDGNPQAIKYYRKYVQLAPNASDLNWVKEKILQAETEEKLRIGGLLDRDPPKDQIHH